MLFTCPTVREYIHIAGVGEGKYLANDLQYAERLRTAITFIAWSFLSE